MEVVRFRSGGDYLPVETTWRHRIRGCS